MDSLSMGSTWAYPAPFTQAHVHLHTFFHERHTVQAQEHMHTLCTELCSVQNKDTSQHTATGAGIIAGTSNSRAMVLAGCLGQLLTAPSWPPFHPGNLAPFPEVLLRQPVST